MWGRNTGGNGVIGSIVAGVIYTHKEYKYNIKDMPMVYHRPMSMVYTQTPKFNEVVAVDQRACSHELPWSL